MKKILFILLSIALSACGIGAKKNKAEATAQAPLKIVVIEDFSISQRKERRIDIYLMRELADSVAKNGGSLAYGTIENHSFKPFEEFTIAEAPPSPETQASKNVFKRDAKAVKAKKMDTYNEDLKLKQTADDTKMAQFLNAVQRRMKNTSKSTRSDIHNAFTRASAIVCGPNVFRQKPRTYVIVASDLWDDWVGGDRRRFTGFACDLSCPMLVVGAQGAGNLELEQGAYLNLSSVGEAARYIFSH